MLLTNSVTSGLCRAIGDLVRQEWEHRSKLLPKRYDGARTVRMFTVGMAIGAGLHFYYYNLDKILPRSDLKIVIFKIACDQVFAAPITLLSTFYGLGILEGKSIQECNVEVRKKFLYVYLGDCLYWPPVQFVNFCFIPAHYRVAYINITTVIFNIFVSYMKHYDQRGP